MEVDNQRGHLVLLMAPTGSGKSVLLRHLRDNLPELHFAVSCTTRVMRPGERDGEVYYFLTGEEFKARIERGEFLEWAEYAGHLYGTLKSEVLVPMQAGKVVVREVELQGIQSILGLLPKEDVTVIYVDAGSWEGLKKRILSRSPMDEEQLALRYSRYLKETEARPLADVIIHNHDGALEEAKKELEAAFQEIIDHRIKKL